MVLGLFESIGPALAFAVGGTLVIRGHLALGTVVAFVTVLKRLYGPASQLAIAHVDLKTIYAYFDRIFAVMDRTPAIRNSEEALIPSRIVGDVEFRGVSLAYDDAGEVLSRINLNVPAGATIGLVGPSGVGKTSLVVAATCTSSGNSTVAAPPALFHIFREFEADRRGVHDADD